MPAASSPSLSSSSSEEDSDDDKGSNTKSTPNKSNDNRDDDDDDDGADDDVANGDNEEEEESGEDSVLSEDDVKKLCIGVKEFIAGLQDEGKLGKKLKDDKSGLRLMTWPELSTAAAADRRSACHHYCMPVSFFYCIALQHES